MCEWGTITRVRMEVPACLSSTGQVKMKDIAIDSCIADLVAALYAGSISMENSCCGHGKCPGHIVLQDGRTLVVLPARGQHGSAKEKR